MKTLLLLLMLASHSAYAVTAFRSPPLDQGAIAGWDLPGKRGGYLVTVTAVLNNDLYAVFNAQCSLRSFYGQSVLDKFTYVYRYDFIKIAPTITMHGLLKSGYPDKTHINLDCLLNHSDKPTKINAYLNAISIDSVRDIP